MSEFWKLWGEWLSYKLLVLCNNFFMNLISLGFVIYDKEKQRHPTDPNWKTNYQPIDKWHEECFSAQKSQKTLYVDKTASVTSWVCLESLPSVRQVISSHDKPAKRATNSIVQNKNKKERAEFYRSHALFTCKSSQNSRVNCYLPCYLNFTRSSAFGRKKIYC